MRLSPAKTFRGAIDLPGDKSISHRALLFGAIAEGQTRIRNLGNGEDVRSTANCLRNLGASIEQRGDTTIVAGVGIKGFLNPTTPLDCGNSGTTMRSLLGLLASETFPITLVGDTSLSKRPMKRVLDPLTKMGATFIAQDGHAPIEIKTARALSGITYELPVASGQVKTALLLAGLRAQGETCLTGKLTGRDHTERLLPFFGAKLETTLEKITITGGQTLHGADLLVPGDTSSAAFWIGGAVLIPGSDITIKNVLLNETRTGLLSVLKRMGAKIDVTIRSEVPELTGDLHVGHSTLRGVSISEAQVPSLIDEIPLLAVLASQATGTTILRGASELRVKESDRLAAIAENLKRMGVSMETFEDGFQITGPQTLKGAFLSSFDDHRIAMAFSIASLFAKGGTTIENAEAVSISYPTFFQTLETVCRA